MIGLKTSIQRTISYAGYFSYPLDIDELFLWLIGDKLVSKKKIQLINKSLLSKKEYLYKNKLKLISSNKITSAKKIAKILSYIPTIELVAITGSVAIGNAKELDDIDLLIITKDHTLWFSRPLVLAILSIVGKRRRPNSSYLEAANTYCPNLWLEKCTLLVPKEKQNLYTAHEVLQIMPIFDRNSTYQEFIRTNSWVSKYLANAFHIKNSRAKIIHSFSVVLNTFKYLIFPLNTCMYIAQYLYMKPKLTKESVKYHSAYFHIVNFAQKIDKHFRNNRVGYN